MKTPTSRVSNSSLTETPPLAIQFPLVAAVLLLLSNSSQAQSAFTWNGGSGASGNWSDGANWGGSGPSNPQGYLNFDGSTRLANTNDFSNGGPGFQIYFKSTAGAFNLFGNSITFYDFGSVDPNIQNEGTGNTQTINFPIVNGNTHGANGILNINANASPAQGPLTFNGTITAADATIATRAINVSGPSTVTFNGVISDFSPSGKIALTQLGTGRTILAATNTFTGDLTISAGTVQLGNGTTSNGSVVGNITHNATLVFANPNAQSYGGVISGSGTVTKSNAAVLTLSGGNTYSGGTTLAAGTLKLGAANVVGTGNITNNGATLDLNGQTLTNAITTITSGGLITNSSGAAATVSTAIGNPSVSQLGSFTVGASGNISFSDVYGQQFACTLTKAGAGTLTLGGTGVNGVSGNPLQLAINSGTVVLAKTSTGTAADGVTVNSGALLQMDPTHTTTGWQSWAGQLNAGVNLQGGTFDMNGTSGNNNQMQWITGSAGGLLTNSSATHAVLTLRERGSGPYANAEAIGGNLSMNFQLSTGSGATFNFTGNHSQNGTNTISTGTVALSGNNTTTGSTIVNGGTLALNSGTALGTTALTISSGALDNTSGAPVTQANNNAQTWSGNFTFNGTTNLNLGSGAVNATTSIQVTTTNSLTVGGTVSGGANSLTKAGPGTLVHTGNNTWGIATLNNGTLMFAGTSGTPTESLGKVVLGNNATTIGSAMIFSNTVANITGANNTTVGGNATSTNNTLWIQNSTWNGNGQRLELTAGIGNAAIIDNSVATNFISLIGGNSTTVNGSTLIVTNGGKLYVNATGLNELGRNNGAISNSIIITGAGSEWYNNSGGTATTGFSVGGTSGTVSNSVVQVNNGALWNHGGGTMRLNVGNFSSGIVLNGGVLTNVYSFIIGNGANSNFVNVLNGGKFYCTASSGDFREIGRGSAANNSLLISGAGSLWNGGGATWTVAGTTGGSNNTNDSLTVASSGVFTNGSITVGGQGTGHSLVVSNGTVYAGSLTVNSSANVFLNGGNGDALYVDNFSAGSSSSYITGSVAGASSSLIAGWQNGSSTVTPTVTGNIGLIKTGTGTLTLGNSANAYNGGTTIKAGTVSVASATQLGTNTVTVGDSVTGADATLLVTANVTVTNNITVAFGPGIRTLSGTSVANTTTFSGNVTLNTNLTVNKSGLDLALTGTLTGTGNLTVTNPGTGAVFLSGPSSPGWTGNCIILAGLVAPGGTSQLNSNTVMSVASSATFNNFNNSVTLAGLNDITGASGGTLNGGFSTPVLTLRGTGNYSFSGAYSGAGGLSVSLASSGSQTLSGANTYTGATTIGNGTLLVNGSLGSSSVVTVNGGTLGGNGTVGGAVTVNSGGTLAPGTSIGTLALGSLVLNSGSTVAMEIGNGPTGDKASASGSVTYGGTLRLIWTGTIPAAGTVDLFDGSGFSGAFSSLQLSNWPSAYRVNTGNLAVDGSIAITTNNAPTAQNITIGVPRGAAVIVQLVGGKHGATDADGDSVAVTAVGTPTSGSVSFNASNATYTASGNLGTNTFTYTVTDAFGATDVKTVTAVVTDPQGFNQVSAGVSGANAVLTYLGIPGTNYALDVTHTLPATNWVPVITNPAAGSGYLYFTNPISLSPTNDYYRTRYVP